MTTTHAPDPEWMRSATGETATLLDVWDGTPSLFLIPAENGAILWWQFDQGEDDSQYVLLIHLNESEAQAVFDARSGNPISAVRSRLEDNRALISRRHPSGEELAVLYEIPRQFSDDQFFSWIDDIGEMLASRDPLPTPDPEVQRRHWARLGDAAMKRLKGEMSDIDRLAATVSQF